MIIIVDTNFLIYCSKYKIDLLSELSNIYPKYEVLVPQKVFNELQKLKKGHGKDNFAASLALEMMKKMLDEKKMKIQGLSSKNADDEIVKLVEQLKEINKSEKIRVGTMDIKLSDKIKRLGAGILKIRQKKRISEE